MNGIDMSLDNIFFEQRNTLIKMLFLIVGCYQTAEDLTQDAYVKVSGAMQEYPVDYPRAFLFQTARNLALDHLRKEKVRGNNIVNDDLDEDATFEVASPEPCPERKLHLEQEINILQKVLAEQPQQRREMLILNKVHGWRYDEIADYFKLSRSAVEKNIRITLANCLAAYTLDPQ